MAVPAIIKVAKTRIPFIKEQTFIKLHITLKTLVLLILNRKSLLVFRPETFILMWFYMLKEYLFRTKQFLASNICFLV